MSSILVLLLSGIICFLASSLSRWVPYANERYVSHSPASEQGGLLSQLDHDVESSRTNVSMPDRPKRYFLPLIVSCVVIRLEIFYRVTALGQCSTLGIEVRHPLTLLVTTKPTCANDRSPFSACFYFATRYLPHAASGLFQSQKILMILGEAFSMTCTTGLVDLASR